MPQPIDIDPSADFYKVLGVTEKSTADEIKKAYRKLAKQYHPDSTGGDKAKESKFKTISVAYDVLGDSKKREFYDQTRANGGASGGDATFGYGQYGGTDFNLSDLFGQFFHPPTPNPSGRSRVADFETTATRASPASDGRVCASDGSWLRVDGVDVHSDVTISFDRAILGTIVIVATIEGKSEVRIPGGSSSGRKLRMRGKGMNNPNGFTGDHHVTVQIEVPGAGDLDDDARRLLQQLVAKLKKTGGHR